MGHINREERNAYGRAIGHCQVCRHCNIGLGHFKDSPHLLATAIDYLRKHQQE